MQSFWDFILSLFGKKKKVVVPAITLMPTPIPTTVPPVPAVVPVPVADHKAPSVAVVVTMPVPNDGHSISNDVHFTASAISDKKITGWAAYADDQMVYFNNIGGVLLDAHGLLAPGQRRIILRAWNSAGEFGDASFTLNLVLDK